jgi:hypothetical protein
LPGLGHVLGEGGVEAGGGIHHPQTIGADEPYRTATQLLLNLLFESGTLRAALTESSRNHDRRIHASLDTFPDQTGNGGRRGSEHSQLDVLGNVTDDLPGFGAEEFGTLRIDGIEPSVKSGRQKILQHCVADASRAVGGADESYGIGIEQRIEAVFPGWSRWIRCHARDPRGDKGEFGNHKASGFKTANSCLRKKYGFGKTS